MPLLSNFEKVLPKALRPVFALLVVAGILVYLAYLRPVQAENDRIHGDQGKRIEALEEQRKVWERVDRGVRRLLREDSP